jgi:hypothetical protein
VLQNRRKKGAKNKRTLLLEGTTRQLLDNAGNILGENTFEGDTHALLILTYKNTSLPLQIRLDAAKAAIRFEKPALSAIDAHVEDERFHYVVSDEPMTDEEWKKSTARHRTSRHNVNKIQAEHTNGVLIKARAPAV